MQRHTRARRAGSASAICYDLVRLLLFSRMPMAILVFNSGSSSLKFRLYAGETGGELCAVAGGAVTEFGERAAWTWRTDERETNGRIDARTHRDATRWALQRLRAESSHAVEAIGHRVVHGGDVFSRPVRLTADAIARIDALGELAPLHNPLSLEVIRACQAFWGDTIPMVAVFDTAFHAAIPPAAYRYALPEEWVRAHGIRRYGFHGLAHRSMLERYRRLAGDSSRCRRIVSFQLGNGCSAAAIRDGVSVDTSMGYTPIEGLIMSTRSGDVDPGALARLATTGVDAAELETGLNDASGLLALSNASADMRTLLALDSQGHGGARRAIEAFCHRARKYLGAYLAVLGGGDAVLFGGGIGENAPAIRERICADMTWCGLRLDPRANVATVGSERRISAEDATMAAYVIAVDEEILIARDTLAVADEGRV
jgi:acetate kinase